MTDDDLVRQFEDCTLPADLWTHRAHIRVAFVYLRKYGFDEAVERMRKGLYAYIEARGVEDGPTTGYNETTTVAFMYLVHAMMTQYGREFPTPDADSFCDTHPQLLNSQVLRLFYSPERRTHPDAKHKFVEPDLTPLPRTRR